MTITKKDDFLIINNVAYDVNNIDLIRAHYINYNFIFQFITKDDNKVEIIELQHNLRKVEKLCKKLNKLGYDQFAMMGYKEIINMDNIKSLEHNNKIARVGFKKHIYESKMERELFDEFLQVKQNYEDSKQSVTNTQLM